MSEDFKAQFIDFALSDSDALNEVSYPNLTALKNIEENYSNFTLIGEGALKKVYKCLDNRTLREVAFTKPREELDSSFHEIFVYEARLTAALKHPNIIKVHELSIQDDQTPYFIMDLKGNHTLQTTAPISSLRENLEVLIKVCDAISYAHSQNIIHLDLKPENIQCDQFGEVLVCDWGLAKRLEPEETSQSQLSVTHSLELERCSLYGSISGTPGYMSPEQASGQPFKDERSDIFSLGCILYFILTGSEPFTGTTQQRIDKTEEARFSPLPSKTQSTPIPRGLKATVYKALACDPDDRYQSVAQLKSDLQRYLQGFSTSAERPSLYFSALRVISRNKRFTTTVAIAFALLMCLGLFSQYAIHQRELIALEERQKSTLIAQELSSQIENEALFDDSLADNHEFIHQINTTTKQLSSHQFTDTPKTSLMQAEVLALKMLKLRPDNSEANALLVWIYCLQLNFEAALDIHLHSRHKMLHRLRKYAEAFPQLHANHASRPSIQQLINLIKFIQEQGSLETRFIHSVIHYDYHVRQEHEQYYKVLNALMDQLNRNVTNFSVQYIPQSKSLAISAPRLPSCGYLNQLPSVLSYYDLDTLILNIKKPITDPLFLKGVKVREIQLHNAQQIDQLRAIEVLGLDTVVLHGFELEEHYIRSIFHSDKPYRILSRPK